jgi:hypothetical protein
MLAKPFFKNLFLFFFGHVSDCLYY